MSSVVFNHTAHKDLWNWLAENPGMNKIDWPGWDNFVGGFGAVVSACFACDALTKHADNNPDCKCCPLVWPATPCCFFGLDDGFFEPEDYKRVRLYDLWADRTDKINFFRYRYSPEEFEQLCRSVSAIAARIRDLPVRDGVKCI